MDKIKQRIEKSQNTLYHGGHGEIFVDMDPFELSGKDFLKR